MIDLNSKNTLKVYLYDQEMVEEESDGTNISINPVKRGTVGKERINEERANMKRDLEKFRKNKREKKERERTCNFTENLHLYLGKLIFINQSVFFCILDLQLSV